MTAGDEALAGDPDAVRQAGLNAKARTVAAGVFAQLISAARGLGGQSGNAVSVEHLLTMIQATSAPVNLLQSADQELGASLMSYGSQVEGLQQRARSVREDLADAESAVALARTRLGGASNSSGYSEGAEEYRRLLSEVDAAQARSSSAAQRLRFLDEERLGANAAAVAECQRAPYLTARSALPEPPRVAANARVKLAMPDGSLRFVTAFALARVEDPKKIRELWERLTEVQRDLLIADAPLLIGNLEGVPIRDRHAANVIAARTYRAELEQQIRAFMFARQQEGWGGMHARKLAELRGEVRSIDAMLGDRNGRHRRERGAGGRPFGVYEVYAGNGIPGDQNGLVLVSFDPVRDSYVTFHGALDPESGDVAGWIEHIGVLVPGTNSRLADFVSDLGRGQDLYQASGARSGYFTWHGAPMPRFEPPERVMDPALRGFADEAAPRLASFVNSLMLPRTTSVVPVAHSYGAVVLGGAEYLGLRADRVVYVAPAGLGHNVSGIAEFPRTRNAPHFVLQARNDLVVGWNQGRVAHGPTNPLEAEGVVRLETGHLKHRDPSSGTIESPGKFETHTTPFTRGSTSMRNIAGVVSGKPVSLFHENDKERAVRGGRVVAKTQIVDSGAAKPEELISPINLEPVP